MLHVLSLNDLPAFHVQVKEIFVTPPKGQEKNEEETRATQETEDNQKKEEQQGMEMSEVVTHELKSMLSWC